MIIMIEFDSTKIYNNFECGGSLEIEFKNNTFWQNKNNQFPPCKSFYDASQRISQYNNYLKKYRNVKTIVLLNYDWKNVLLKPSSGLLIQNNCFFQIKVLNDSQNSIISIDGQNLNSFSFISIEYNINNELYCDSEIEQEQELIPTRLKLENFKLINFNTNFIGLRRFYQDFKFKNKYQFVSFELNSIIVIKSKYILEAATDDFDFQIQYLINNSHFSNYSSDDTFLVCGKSSFVFNNCTFNNIIVSSFPIIYTFNLTMTNCSFDNIINNFNKNSINNFNKNYNPMIQISNFGILNTINVNGYYGCSTFLLQSPYSNTFNDSSIKLSKIFLKLNNILNSNYLFNINYNDDNNYFKNYIQLYQIYIDNPLNSKISILNSSKSFIDVDNDSINSFLINSNLLFNGKNNIILLNKYNDNFSTTQQQLEFIKNLNNCSDCLFSINGNNISTKIIIDSSELNFDNSSGSNSGGSTTSKSYKGFNKIFLIPIILGSISIITITLFVLFKVKIIKKNNNQNDNNNDINEDNIDVVGEIVMN
ncbi:hypothetical protein ACTA71_000410 [Dictyostelium dimigraforme]